MKTLNLILILLTFTFFGCNTESKSVTDKEDYNQYIESTNSEKVESELNDLAFWENKLESTPNQFPYIHKMASVNESLFEIKGDIAYLSKAEELLLQVNEITNFKNVSYLQSLASNYIKQHKFNEALNMLAKAEHIGEDKETTNKMLFDVHLELGNNLLAEFYLKTFKKEADFDYLIRYAKWSDHNGNLEEAISALEKAQLVAESSNMEYLKSWTYTNLADFYGHAGEIKKSYNSYLKALSLNPTNAYAKKGIAWILYSYEKNPEEALRVLNKVTQDYKTPDYYLLKSEIYNYLGDTQNSKTNIETYFAMVSNSKYGAMYNKHNILEYAENSKKIDTAILIAKEEVNNRPTAQSYDLLAWSYYKKGDVKKALKIVEEHVLGHTFEPESLYHMAEIFKANGIEETATNLKKELLEAEFELGPIMIQKISKI